MDFVQKLHPEWVERVKHFTSDLPIFEAFAIEKEIEAARTEAADARRDAAAQRAQAEALDAQLARFQDLPSALHQALVHANPKPKPQRAAKRSHLSSGKQPAPPKAG